jgi:glycosyltransferase involved in cell wall biosynthesis
MHVAAVALKRRWACPWIAEFRDPWPMPPPSALATRYSRWLERQVLQSVAGVVTVAPGAARLYRAKLNWLPEDRIVMAMNGVDTIAARREPRAPHRVLDVVYSGSLYPPRSLLPQLQAFAALRRAGALPPMRIVLLGECRLYGETDMPAACAELGLADVVEFRGWVPAEESRRIVAQADLLLLPAQEWRHQIPNKLFDYLGARVPIFALCEPDSDPAELLETAGGHFVAYGENPGTLTATLRAALEAAKIGSAASRLDLLDELSVESQMRRLVQWTEHLVRVAGGAAGPPSGHDSAGSAA